MRNSPREILKHPETYPVAPNLGDWAAACRDWSWERIEGELGRPARGLNLGWAAIDRHVAAGRGNDAAMIWESTGGAIERFTFDEMRRASNRFANALRSLGVGRGDRVVFFLPRVPELYFAMLGTLKAGGVVVPMFSSFGPDPVKERVVRCGARVLVTNPGLWGKLKDVRGEMKEVRSLILVDREERGGQAGAVDYAALTGRASEEFEIAETGREDLSVIHFTSGSTGRPKGAALAHGAAVAYYATGKYQLDLRAGDRFWCTADPGWVTGTSYGMFAPWLVGATNLVYEGGFAAGRWYDLIERHRVTVWYTAPTAVRMLMKAGSGAAKKRDLSSLRFSTCAGEPLDAGAVEWTQEAWGRPIHDNYWQTETGTMMIANFATMPIRPGSMGRAFPGIDAAIVDGEGRPIEAPMTEGRLAIRSGFPSMFRAYWEDEERYRERFQNGWYITGDLARRDADGYFWFGRREDDTINTAGHLVGPFEVESALMEHPAVAEAAAIGKPDATALEIVKAFVTLHAGHEPTEALRRALFASARQRLGAGIAPREIDFVESLPKTRSGKIMRRLLRARELGLPEGDTSTLEEDGEAAETAQAGAGA